MTNDPLDFKMKIRQGIVFIVANSMQLLPLALFAYVTPTNSLQLAFPLLLFYAGNKTGLLLINGLGKVTAAYHLTQLSLGVGLLAAFVLGLTNIPIVDDLTALLLGLSASVVLVAFQTVYYVERTTWHWNIGAVELISGVLYVALAAGLMVLISRWQVRWTFLGLALFQGLALWLLRQFPNFIRQDQHPLTRAGSRSNNDIELFVWLTLLVLGLRDVRQFANQLALLFLGIVLLGFFAFLARILFKNQVKIHFPWWHILASFLNGATETFAMLYILFVADPDNKWAIPLGYLYYALGFLAGQVLRKPLQKWLKPLSDLTLQLLGFTLGSWLLVSHFTLPLGLFIIGFVGTANSILLNHAAFQLPIGAQQNRLMVKYRNVYLGSILAQFLMLLTLGITALALQGHFLAPLTTVHRLATTNNQAAVLIMGCILALIITLDALAVFLVAPKVDEQPLYK